MTSRISDITYLIFRCLAALPQAVFSPSTISVWSFIIQNNNDMSSVVCLHWLPLLCNAVHVVCMWYFSSAPARLPRVSRCYHQSEFLFPLHEAAAAHAAPAAVSPDNNAHQSGVERFKTCNNCQQFSSYGACNLPSCSEWISLKFII